MLETAEIVAKEGDYVICYVTKESSIKWPNCDPITTYFVGHILQISGNIFEYECGVKSKYSMYNCRQDQAKHFKEKPRF